VAETEVGGRRGISGVDRLWQAAASILQGRSGGFAAMSRARGQPSGSSIDREYSHQVIVPAEDVGGKHLPIVEVFHAYIDAPKRSRSVFNNDRWYDIYCFTEAHQARGFQAIFGGEIKRVGN
jgi:hypothetical protein